MLHANEIIRMLLNEELDRRASIEAADIEAAKQDNDTPLHFAAKNGHTETVQKLLNKNANVEAINKYNNTPLHLAAFNNRTEVVQKLLNKNANIEAINKYNNTPLHLAAQNGHTEVVQKLLNKNANIEAANQDNDSPLHLAAFSNRAEVIQKLLNKNANIEAINKYNNTPLHLAAQNGHIEVIQKLLNKNANIEAINKYNNTPLHLAAFSNRVEVVQKLLNKNANTEAINKYNNTPLHLAAQISNSKIVQKLLNSGADVHIVNGQNNTPLHLAAQIGNSEVVQKLLNNGANIHAVNDQNNTPLHLAAQVGNSEVVQKLLNNGADIHTVNDQNNTPLHLAAQSDNTEVVEKLLNNGADIHAVNDQNNTPLHFAAQSDNSEVVEKLLNSRADIHAVNGQNNTPLHLAAQVGNSEVVQKLLNNGADIHAVNDQNNTPLHFAAQSGNSEVVEKLLDKNVNFNARTMHSYTPLHFAAQNGYAEIVQRLLNKEATVDATTFWENYTPLHLAAQNGHAEVVQKLLDRNVNFDARSIYNNTPLHFAAQSGNSEVVQALLNSGADVHVVNGQNNTPLHFAAQSGNSEAIQNLLNSGANIHAVNGQNNTPLHFAAKNGHAEIVQRLLSKNANVEIVNRNNDTPLHLAAKNGHAEVVQKLLNNKADIHVVNDQNNTPLHFAAQSGNSEVVQKLLDKSASVEKVNKNNDTPLHFAARKGNIAIVQKLLNSGADVNVVNDQDNTPLHFAAQNEHAAVVQRLLSKNANIEVVNQNNDTPLHFAARHGNIAVVQKLLNSGADVHVANDQDNTPLHFAARNGHVEVVEKLLNKKADVNASTSNRDYTPLHLAAKNGNLEIVKLLVNKGANISAVDNAGNTPLHLAALKGHLPVVQELLNSERDIDRENQQGDTALHLATLQDHLEVVRFLSYRGADIKKQNNNDQTPLESSIDSYSKNVGKMLIEFILVQDVNVEKPLFLSRFKDESADDHEARVVGRELSEYWDECKSKIESMKDINIGSMGNKNVSLYDFFTADDSNLGQYVKRLDTFSNPELDLNQLLRNFSEFAEAFICKIEIGHLYNVIEEKMNFYTEDKPILPLELVEKINNSFSHKDRQSLLSLGDNDGKILLRLLTSSQRNNENLEQVKNDVEDQLRETQEHSDKDGAGNLAQEVEAPRPLDAAELNKDEVRVWEKPKISTTPQDSTTTRFDGQIILQLENDPIVMGAAARLAAKHPESSVIVQLDDKGNYQVVYGTLDTLKENLRWQVVGHGRTDKTLGGYNATALADKIADFTIELDTEYDINSSPKYISLVGCSLIDNVEMNYARELALSLDEQGISTDIAARSARITVTDAGRKLTEDSSGNWSHKISEEKVIYAWNQDGELELQVGKRAAELLKSMDLAQNFHQAMSELYKSNQLPEGKWWPILRNVTEDTKTGNYPVQFTNAEQQLQTVTTHDRRIINFIEDYNTKLAETKTVTTHDRRIIDFIEDHNTKLAETKAALNVESIDGLNSAFIVKTLIPWFANKSRAAVADDNVPEILKTALEVHTWVNLAQMGHGAVEDIAKTAQLYRAAIAISEGKEIANVTTSSLRHVSAGVGVLLNLGSVVLDSIELAHAQNEAQKAIYGTQLAFDSAGLVVSGVGIVASIAGATTIAAFAAAGGVILGGLGIGITALAEAFSGVAMSAQAVGNYFANLDAAYSQGGYRHSTKTMKDGTVYPVMEPIPGAVIKTLDLPNKQLIFGSQYIYRNHYAGLGEPGITLDKAQAINIREGIGHLATEASFDYDNTTLILPTTPKSYFSYDYNILPCATWRHDRGFDIARRLEKDERFYFDFYTFPFDRIVCKLRPEYIETSIKVILDEQNREILIPQLLKSIKGKFSYQLCGNGGEYRISLQEGVSLSLQSDNSHSRWVLDARMLNSVEIGVDKNLLKIGDIEIVLSDKSCGSISIIDSNNDIFAIDREGKKKILLEVNDKQFTDWQALHEHLKLYSHPDNHTSFVAIDNYQPVTGGGNVGRAFYDMVLDRFIYTNKPEWSEFLSSAVLAKAEGNKAWFYRNTELWQVEIATGKVLKQYLPFNSIDMEFIDSHVLQHDNQLYMVIKQKLDDNNFTYTYHIEDEALKLVAIDGDTALIARLENSNKEELSSILIMPTSDYDQWLTAKNLVSSGHQVKATPANIVRVSDRWLIFDEYGIKDSVKANAEPKDLMLVFVSEHEGYFFYSSQERSIYFQKDSGLSGTQATKVDVNSVKSIFSHNQKHFALTYEGTLWSLDDQGAAKLAGVAADWLSHHRQNLAKDLGQLAHDTTNKFGSLLLLGMQDNAGNQVNAWYDSGADLIIHGGSNLNAEHNLVYLGLDNDEKQAWIFDDDDQAIYLQSLTNNKNLVFDEKLILTVLGDSAELFHPEQKYVNVVRDGADLRIGTSNGAILLLPVNSDLDQKPTLIAFNVKEREPAQILSALQELTDDCKLPPSVRLLAESSQEPAWYLTEEKKIIHTNGLEAEHFLHYLGKVVGLESWYIHDQNTGKLWSVSNDQSAIVGNYSFVHLEQDYLILQVGEVTPLSLPQLQEASSLIISSKLSGQHHYLLDNSLLKHYQQIVIDDQGTIELNLENDSAFSLQRSGKDIILNYDSLNTDILISNIEQAVQQGMVLKVCDKQLPLNQLLTELDNSNNYLQLTINEDRLLIDGDEEFVDDTDSYLSDSGYNSSEFDHSVTTQDYSDFLYTT